MFTYILVISAVVLRLLPHIPNFVPIIAVSMFAGAYLPKKQAVFVPLLIMVLSDLFLGLHDVVLFTWGAMFFCGIIGTNLKNNVKPASILSTTLFSAFMFFLVSNFGVWLVWYPNTFAGLIDCFLKAIPFFRSTFLVNIVVVIVMFSLYYIYERVFNIRKEALKIKI